MAFVRHWRRRLPDRCQPSSRSTSRGPSFSGRTRTPTREPSVDDATVHAIGWPHDSRAVGPTHDRCAAIADRAVRDDRAIGPGGTVSLTSRERSTGKRWPCRLSTIRSIAAIGSRRK